MLARLLSVFSRGNSGSVYEISIDELSKIWLPVVTSPITVSTNPMAVQSTIILPSAVNSSPVVQSVYDYVKDLIEPYQDVIKNKGLWDGFVQLIELLEKYGSYPSVVLKEDEMEYQDVVLSILKNVTIKEHSVKVARLMVSELKKSFKDPSGLIFLAVLACLAHDIGKAEPLRQSPQYSKYEHPLISADVLKSCFPDADLYDVNKAVEIIRLHHKSSNDQLVGALQAADERARMEELKAAGKAVNEITETLSAGDILKIIEPHINIPKSETEWRAFSFKGTVYVDPDFLYEVLKIRNVIFAGQIKYVNKPVFLSRVVQILKNAGALEDVKLAYTYFSWFEVQVSNSSRKMRLIPIKLEKFGKTSGELEERKLTQSRSGMIKFISAVKLSGGRK